MRNGFESRQSRKGRQKAWPQSNIERILPANFRDQVWSPVVGGMDSISSKIGWHENGGKGNE